MSGHGQATSSIKPGFDDSKTVRADTVRVCKQELYYCSKYHSSSTLLQYSTPALYSSTLRDVLISQLVPQSRSSQGVCLLG